MSFGQFVDTVQEQIKSYLPEKYQEAEVRTTEFQKLNYTYVGMTVRQEDQMIAPNINLNAQYEQYIRTGDMDRIFHTIAEQVQLQPEIQTDWLRDYEKVKDMEGVHIIGHITEKGMPAVMVIPQNTTITLVAQGFKAMDR
jgi:hypothetical protein